MTESLPMEGYYKSGYKAFVPPASGDSMYPLPNILHLYYFGFNVQLR